MNQKKNWVDYRELKRRVSIKESLDHYGLLSSVKQKKDELVGFCPFHKESKASFHVSLTKNAFQCFGCKAKGNILDFVQQKEGVELRGAGLLISEWFGTGRGLIVAPEAKEEARKEEKAPKLAKEGEIINPPLKFALKLDPDNPYLKERGLAKETIEHFGLGYCSKGLMKGMIAIPIHNEKGELVAYAGRWPGDPPEGEGKYKLPIRFQKQLVLFNLHRAIAEAQDKLIIVEGFFDCFRIWQAGFKNVIALMGSALSKEQADLLASHARSVALMLDQDDAGEQATKEILSRLARRVFVRVIDLPSEGDQPDRLKEEELVNLLRDV
jgi:DNA primase